MLFLIFYPRTTIHIRDYTNCFVVGIFAIIRARTIFVVSRIIMWELSFIQRQNYGVPPGLILLC
jgi:hypothetical protein